LGEMLCEGVPECERSALVMGLRTAGSFLAPLLCAYLRARFPAVDWVAVRPKKGLASWELHALWQAAGRRARALVIDESIHSGQSVIAAVVLLRPAGVRDDDIPGLNPSEPALLGWAE